MYDCLFVPHNSYHSKEMLEVAGHLSDCGGRVGFICIDDHYKHNHQTISIIAENGFDVHAFSGGILDLVPARSLYVMNDWGGVVHELVKAANNRGMITFGTVEGVNDFDDCGYKFDGVGRIRNPYKTVQHLFLTCKHDLMFFPDKSCDVVGIPRIDPLLSEEPVFPHADEILVNCNFTYGIYEEQRMKWVHDVITVLSELDLRYKINQHPSDDGDLCNFIVSSKDFISDLRNCSLLISRFSGCILESLALGKPCVYYDSFNESIPKFKQPLGAYSRAISRETLKASIINELTEKEEVRKKAKRFLELHLSSSSIEPTSHRIAKKIFSRLNDV